MSLVFGLSRLDVLHLMAKKKTVGDIQLESRAGVSEGKHTWWDVSEA